MALRKSPHDLSINGNQKKTLYDFINVNKLTSLNMIIDKIVFWLKASGGMNDTGSVPIFFIDRGPLVSYCSLLLQWLQVERDDFLCNILTYTLVTSQCKFKPSLDY